MRDENKDYCSVPCAKNVAIKHFTSAFAYRSNTPNSAPVSRAAVIAATVIGAIKADNYGF